jgi:hypothetical protein
MDILPDRKKWKSPAVNAGLFSRSNVFFFNQQELLHLQVMPVFFVTFLIVMKNTSFLSF